MKKLFFIIVVVIAVVATSTVIADKAERRAPSSHCQCSDNIVRIATNSGRSHEEIIKASYEDAVYNKRNYDANLYIDMASAHGMCVGAKKEVK